MEPISEKKVISNQKISQMGVYAWGLNKHLALGVAITPNQNFVHNVAIKDKCIQISQGGYFGGAVCQNGNFYMWGYTKGGRLGDIKSSQGEETLPQKINIPYKISQIACGNWHTIILTEGYQILSTGHNSYGSLGLKDNQSRNQFTLIPDVNNARFVSAGDGQSCYIDDQKQLFSCGHRYFLIKLTQLRERNGLKKDEHLNQFKQIKCLQNVQYVDCGFTHTCAVTGEGQIYSWGLGNFYQLGHGNKENQQEPKLIDGLIGIQITQVSCTRGEKNCHTGAICVEGFAYTWGSGYKGKLGHQKKWAHDDPADQPLPKKIEAVNNIKMKKITSGGIHTNLLSEDGKIYTFGCGSDGRLGHPEFQNYVYLYREGLPRQLEVFQDYTCTDIAASYYHNACIIE